MFLAFLFASTFCERQLGRPMTFKGGLIRDLRAGQVRLWLHGHCSGSRSQSGGSGETGGAEQLLDAKSADLDA